MLGVRWSVVVGVTCVMGVVAIVVVLSAGSAPRVVQPTQLPARGGPLTAGRIAEQCDSHDGLRGLGDGDNPECRGNYHSVLGIDVRRSRFLVAWREDLTDQKGDHTVPFPVMARFVSVSGRLGRKVMLSGLVPGPGAGPLSVAYQVRADRFVVSWDQRDHFLSAESLAVVAPSRRAEWASTHEYNVRDPRAQLWGHGTGQLGRIPATGVGLAIWDDYDTPGPIQVNGQILPPGKTCRGSRKCEPLGPA